MPLQKQNAQIVFTEGVNTGADEKIVNTPIDIENGQFDTLGSLTKRPGAGRYTKFVYSGDEPDRFDHVLSANDELTAIRKTTLWAKSGDKWKNVGPVGALTAQRNTLAPGLPGIQAAGGFTAGGGQVDVGHVQGFDVVIYTSTARLPYAVVMVDGQVAVAPFQLSTAANTNVKAISYRGRFVSVLYSAGSSALGLRTFDAKDASWTSEFTLANASSPIWCGYNPNDDVCMGSNTAGGNEYRYTFDETGFINNATRAAAAGSNLFILGGGVHGSTAIQLQLDTTTPSIRASTFVSTAALSRTDDIVENHSATVYQIRTSTNIHPAIVRSLDGGLNSDIKIYFTVNNKAGNDYVPRVRVADYNITSGAASGLADYALGTPLISDPIVVSDEEFYFVAETQPSYDTALEIVSNVINRNYVVLDSAGSIVAATTAYAPTIRTHNQIARNIDLAGDAYKLGILAFRRADDDADLDLAEPEVLTLDFNHKPRSADFSQSTYISGGTLFEYDGNDVTESGFIHPPFIQAAAQTSGGSLADGTYLFTAVFRYVNAYGREVLSAPTPSKFATISGGGGSGSIDLEVAMLRATNKEIANVQTVIYMTEVGGSDFYWQSTHSNSTSSEIISETVTNNISTGDTTPYTSGGVVENFSLPSVIDLNVRGNRLYAASYDSRVYFSKDRNDIDAAQFSDLLFKRVNSAGGEIAAIDSIDGNTVIFKEGPSIQAFAGDGPNNLGTDDRFTNVREVATDVGGVRNGYTALTQDGIYFNSPRGIALLGRNLVAQFVGAGVQSTRGLTPSGMVVLADQDEVRFPFSDGRTAVFNTKAGQWSFFKHENTKSAVRALDTYIYIEENGDILREVPTRFFDGMDDYSMTVETNWIKTAGILGFQRVYWASVLGTVETEHTLKVEVYYDYSETVSETISIDSAALESQTPGMLARFKPARQKCSAVKFKIYDDGTEGKHYSISGIMLQVGVKGGVNRLPTSKTF